MEPSGEHAAPGAAGAAGGATGPAEGEGFAAAGDVAFALDVAPGADGAVTVTTVRIVDVRLGEAAA